MSKLDRSAAIDYRKCDITLLTFECFHVKYPSNRLKRNIVSPKAGYSSTNEAIRALKFYIRHVLFLPAGRLLLLYTTSTTPRFTDLLSHHGGREATRFECLCNFTDGSEEAKVGRKSGEWKCPRSREQ